MKMFESLLKSMPSILDDLKKENVESEYSVDVTTDEGIKKVRDSVYNLKGEFKSLRENLKDSWLSFVWDKDTLDAIDTSLDKVLEDAEKKYKEAHENDVEKETSKPSDTVYMRPVLSLTVDDSAKVYDVVDKYVKTEICPRLPEDANPEFVQSISDSLADFAAWIMLNKY